MELQNFKCKNCGGVMQATTNENGVLNCEYCGSIFTIPKKDSNSEVLYFLRIGEHNLDTCRFDEAYTAFEKASQLNINESEAYWGMALAEFKVQYIKDVVNNRLQPICHEFNDKEFQANKNYLKALKCAGAEQKSEYFSKAQDIDYIREEFLKLQQSGLDYDCFICVKVSQTGVEQADISKKNWTNDAYNADSIYDLLKRHDFRPFFSEREIKGRSGANYEAMILYALYTAETMLVVCSDEEYLRTPWVKNEYTRFKSLIKNEEKENDSLTIVYNGKPIDRLPIENNGRIQGIDYSRREADFEIVKFVENHTPIARARREDEARKKQEEEAKRAQETQELKRQLDEMKYLVQNRATSTAEISDDIIVEKMTKALMEKERREKEERERQEREMQERKMQERERREIEDFLNSSSVSNDGTLIKYNGNSKNLVVSNIVKHIGNGAFENCKSLESVILPNSVESIGEFAFGGCNSLQSITIPNSVTSIEKEAFKCCESLQSITIPDSVESIGESAFEGCSSLNSITIPDSITSIGDDAFNGCRSLQSISFPNGLESIGEFSFQYCSSLQSIMIPNSVTSIGAFAFADCENLKNIAIPNGIVSIEMYAFCDCESLESVTIPNSVESIGEFAFGGCNSLQSITIPNSVTSIEKEAFKCCESLQSITIPDSVESIGESAFEGCSSLQSMTIPDSITYIKNGTFSGCSSLQSIKIPKNVVSIGWYAFSNCSNLQSVLLSNNVNSIGGSAFCDCSNLQAITLSNNVTCIGDGAFEDCDNLTNVTMPKRFKRQRREIFKGCKLKKIKFTYTE